MWPDVRFQVVSTSPLQRQLSRHTHSPSAEGQLITMTTCHRGNWPVGVSGTMGVQVSLVLVSSTSWLFFPSLKIPRRTTHSLTHTNTHVISTKCCLWKWNVNERTNKSISGSQWLFFQVLCKLAQPTSFSADYPLSPLFSYFLLSNSISHFTWLPMV